MPTGNDFRGFAGSPDNHSVIKTRARAVRIITAKTRGGNGRTGRLSSVTSLHYGGLRSQVRRYCTDK